MRRQIIGTCFFYLCAFIVIGYFSYQALELHRINEVTGSIKANNLDEAVTHKLELGSYTDRKDGVLFFGEAEVVLKKRNHALLGTSELTMKYFDLSGYDFDIDLSSMRLCDEKTCYHVDNASESLVERLNNSPKSQGITTKVTLL